MNNDIEIAESLTIKDWHEISKNLKSSYNNNWREAYDFFKKRIETRYLKPIKTLLQMGDNKGEGFAIVNLQCSLIETIECFINGWVYKYPYFIDLKGNCFRENKKIFKSFFNNRTQIKIKGDDFFINVRCSLLHETQTKNDWKIRKGLKISYEEKDGLKILYRDGFQTEIEKVVRRYRESIIEGKPFDNIPACDLRENFIAKMNHICVNS